MTVDVGTGDGRAVLEAAARLPSTLALGMDANAPSMAELSRRAARPLRKGGLPNAAFVLAAAEAPPCELEARADLVTVRFPWGSLLRGVLGCDPRVAAGLAALIANGGEIEVLLAPAARDGLHGLPTRSADVAEAVSMAFDPLGFALVERRVATTTDVQASGSTWAKRLGAGRPVGARDSQGEGIGAPNDRAVTLVRLARTGHR